MAYNKNLIYLVRRALKEDIGKSDITTELTIPKDKFVKAVLLAKQNCVVCGLDIARFVFKTKDNKIQFEAKVKDGDSVKKGKTLACIKGRAQSVLTVERVALNYLCLLSGIATETRKYVNAVRPYKAKIFDTRKTIPGLRELQKYAVKIGGGHNHRMRLDEMILVKDNHLKVVGYGLWVMGFKRIRDKISSKIKIEFEVKTLKEFKEALKLRPDIIMLDNMSIKDMKKAVSIRNSQTPSAEGGSAYGGKTKHQIPKLEASGRMTLKNIKNVASCGVDMISIGALTHSVNSVDISLEIL